MTAASERVRRAMGALDRATFLPPAQRRFADTDVPLPIGHGATCSQPSTVARMLELLDPQPGDRVLDVGCGSGWTTAILDVLVAPDGQVHGVELEPELVTAGAANVRRAGRRGPVVSQADARVLGRPTAAPFDRILVSAEAAELPAELVEQVAVGGRLVVPVDGEMLVVDRDEEGIATRRGEGTYRFVPLRQDP